MARLLSVLLLSIAIQNASPQSIAKLPLPSMEWIKVSTSGSGPPPLSGACLSGDATADGKVVLVGGISASGTLTATTYILELTSLTWRSPSSAVSTFQPAARANAICTYDRSSNFRSEVLLFGGLQSLSPPTGSASMYAFEMNYEFWSEIENTSGSPTSVFDAAGGVDPTISVSSQDVYNPFIAFGGYVSNEVTHPQGAVIGGTISSNVESVTLTWGDFDATYRTPSRWGSAGVIIGGSKTALVSGCNASDVNNMEYNDFAKSNAACASSDLSVLSFPTAITAGSSFSSLGEPSLSLQSTICPAPRIGGKMVPNRSQSSNSYSSQAILIGGLIDPETWDDQDAATLGEVAVLDLGTETWSRVIPAGSTVPVPRTNPSVFALSGAISNVGTTSSGAVDILMFGGRDVETGDALNDVWVLRLHGGNPVTDSVDGGMTYLSQCASKVATPTSTSSPSASTSTSTSDPTSTSTAQPQPVEQSRWTVSQNHKYLSVLSIVLIFPAILALRYTTSFSWTSPTVIFGLILLIISYAFGVIGVVIGICTAKFKEATTLAKRAETHRPSLFSTLHARVGIALFAIAYGLFPLIYILIWWTNRSTRTITEINVDIGGIEKPKVSPTLVSTPDEKPSTDQIRKDSDLSREPSKRSLTILRPSRQHQSPRSSVFDSSDSDSEVELRDNSQTNPPSAWKLKRPRLSRNRRDKSGSSSNTPIVPIVDEPLPEEDEGVQDIHPRSNSVSSFQVLNRKRPSMVATPGMLSSASDFDSRPDTPANGLNFHSHDPSYLSTFNNYLSASSRYHPVSLKREDMMNKELPVVDTPNTPMYPKISNHRVLTGLILHLSLFFASIYLAVTLFSTSKGLFAGFIAWVSIFYIVLFVLAVRRRPPDSTLAILFYRLRTTHVTPESTPPVAPQYLPHQHARSTSWDESSIREEEEDDDAAERHLSTREVQVMTIPRRHLSVINT